MASCLKKSSSRRSEDGMDDDSDDKDSKRKSRNLSEKKRRDQFNLLVNELSSMVSTGGRKMDKSTVLKSTISFLKNHNEITVRSRIHEIQEDWKPTFLTNEEFTHLILEAVDGFIMVFSASGQIFYASESITSLLGHLPNDALSMTIYEMAAEEEQSQLYNVLISPAEDEGQVTFSCHLRRGGTDTKQDLYELVQFVGYFRSDADMVQTESSRYSGYSGEADTRLVFVGTGRVQTPQLIREMPLVDSSKSEFTSRHSLEWKFLFLDHRAPPIIGYLPFELLGTSGYDYYHTDDLEKVVSCHEALMQKGEGTSCYYRFLTKGQQWLWLQTRFYITYHQWNSKPEFIVCTHRVVSYVDVMKQICKSSEGLEVLREPSPNLENDTSTFWSSKCGKSRIDQGPASTCTSMSADSPTSRHSNLVVSNINSSTSLHSTSLNSTSLNSTSLNSTNLHSTNLHSTNSHLTNLHSTNLHSTNLHSTNLHSNNIHSNNIHSNNLHSTNVPSSNLHSNNLHLNNSHSSSLHSNNLHPNSLHSNSLHSNNVHSNTVHSNNAHSNSVHSNNLHSNSLHPSNLHSNNLTSTNLHSTNLNSTNPSNLESSANMASANLHRSTSTASSSTKGKHIPNPLSQFDNPSQSGQQTQFIEPPQYVTAIPMQPMIASFPAPAVLSPLPTVENIVMSTVQSQLQADLQRKHAELQAIIGQQQAELRRVSEQLLMARLGILPNSQQTVNVIGGYPLNSLGVNTVGVSSVGVNSIGVSNVGVNNVGVNSCGLNNGGINSGGVNNIGVNIGVSSSGMSTGGCVSSTTTIAGIPTSMAGPTVIVPSTVPITIPLSQHQANMIFSVPDSNTPK